MQNEEENKKNEENINTSFQTIQSRIQAVKLMLSSNGDFITFYSCKIQLKCASLKILICILTCYCCAQDFQIKY